MGDQEQLLAPYATRFVASRGRIHSEPADALRGPFELDRHRIIECTAFRRLEGKTQVFAPSHHDHFRTRLTHTLEAAQIARCLARLLAANECLAEAITLAHDLGHPPFGHAGESALQELMAGNGGFNHNTHSLRVVEYLEHPFPAFRGLNLTLDTLEGMRNHETKYDQPSRTLVAAASGDKLSEMISESAPSVESQIASLADRIAYNCHDLEDAIGAGLIEWGDLAGLSTWREACARKEIRTDSNIHAVRRVVLDVVLDELIQDAVAVSLASLRQLLSGVAGGEQRGVSVRFSEEVHDRLSEWERFLKDRVYRNPAVMRFDLEGRSIIGKLFEAYLHDPTRLPPRYLARVDEQGLERVVCDFIAGMTDRFCRNCFEKIRAGTNEATPYASFPKPN